ncbi:hypothetical protein R6Q57_005892, partial [Mikania cordata]
GSIDGYKELRDKFLKFNQKKRAIQNPNEVLHIRWRAPKVMKINIFINRVRQPQLCEKLGEDFRTTFDSLTDK